MERDGYACVAEPGGDVANGGPIGVVEVVAGGEELDGLSAGFVEGIEQAGVEALLEEDVGGEGGLHQLLQYSRRTKTGYAVRIGTQPNRYATDRYAAESVRRRIGM